MTKLRDKIEGILTFLEDHDYDGGWKAEKAAELEALIAEEVKKAVIEVDVKRYLLKQEKDKQIRE